MGYWGYRYYDSRLGRWINHDPIGELGGLNPYAYAMNDPATHADALGRVSLAPQWLWNQCPQSEATNPPQPNPDTPQCRKICDGWKREGPIEYAACLAGCAIGAAGTWECDVFCAQFDNGVGRPGRGKSPATLACALGCRKGGLPNPNIPNDPNGITNGCSSPFGDRPSGVDFRPACQRHDLCYGTCGKSRQTCDTEFLNDMLAACAGDPYCEFWAWRYYRAVVKYGHDGYCETQKAKGCPTPRGCP
ncbi:MAG TPA: phospholipase A2 [Phycisphaerae bacterium]|nr:phospholipase A2 [Phycisphaerae bacterium]